ncbi:MAG: hypothetical protein RIT24_2667 [Planctomycetota bacterium]
MSVARELGAWLLVWLGVGVVVAAALWLSLGRLENELQWRDAACPGIGGALLVAGAALRPRARQS